MSSREEGVKKQRNRNKYEARAVRDWRLRPASRATAMNIFSLRRMFQEKNQLIPITSILVQTTSNNKRGRKQKIVQITDLSGG